MDAIVHQIGELFLQAVPTVLIILLFYAILRSIFFAPLLKVMAERDARTIGAQQAAVDAQQAASSKIKQYQDALKQARAQLYSEQEAARKKVLDTRAAQLKDARAKASDEVVLAKQRVASELNAARLDLQATIPSLSAEIARRLLQAPPTPGPRAGQAR